jgi:hypothetical protein
MTYTPKNNWHFKTSVNNCFTEEQFKELEEEYEFSNQDILIFNLGCNMYGDFLFDFDFMGVKFSGVRKLDSINRALWNTTEDDRHIEYIEYEMSSELLAPDTMNDVYYNHEQYK